MKTLSFIFLITIIFSSNNSWGKEYFSSEKIFQFMLADGVVDNLPGFGLTKIAKHELDPSYSPNNTCSLGREGVNGNVSCGAMAKSIKCSEQECRIEDAFSGKIVRVNDGSYGEGFAKKLNKSLCQVTGGSGCVNGFAMMKDFICQVNFMVIRSGIRRAISCHQLL